MAGHTAVNQEAYALLVIVALLFSERAKKKMFLVAGERILGCLSGRTLGTIFITVFKTLHHFNASVKLLYVTVSASVNRKVKYKGCGNTFVI